MNEKPIATLRQGHLGVSLTLAEVRATGVVPAVHFCSTAEAEAFASLLPKYVRAKVTGCIFPGRDAKAEADVCGLVLEKTPAGALRTPCVRIFIAPTKVQFSSQTSALTGAVNETGSKRLAAFLNAIEQNLNIVSSLV